MSATEGDHGKRPEKVLEPNGYNRAQSADMLVRAAELLNDAMVWSSTPEGLEYWETVFDNLKRYAEAMRSGPTCRSCGAPIEGDD